MVIKIYYDDGTIEDFQSTYLPYQDGFLIANDSVNLAVDHIEKHGIVLLRGEFSQNIKTEEETETVETASDVTPLNSPYEIYNGNCQIVSPENVDRILRLTIDGEIVLQRYTDGILRNIMIENLLEDYE